jgi:hypothetical protein
MNNPLAHEKNLYPAFYSGKPMSGRAYGVVTTPCSAKTKRRNDLNTLSFQFGFNLLALAHGG